jgi:CRISPR/Cas system CSM-associated protein Csm2 small subunit
MSMSVSVPEELYRKAVQIAEAQQRAARGSREKFLAVLDKVPDVEPEELDSR